MRKRGHRAANIQSGPLYVSDIAEGYKKKIAKEYRMNLTKSQLRNIDKYKCKHKPKCYINFDEIEITAVDADV